MVEHGGRERPRAIHVREVGGTLEDVKPGAWNPGRDELGVLDGRYRVLGTGEHELAMHVRAALRNGVTPDELKEVLLQCAVYCGVPAANGAFAIAQRVLEEEGAA